MSLAAARWSQKADVTILRLYEAALNIVEKNAHQWSGRMKKLLGDMEVGADLRGKRI
jgi:hypothetical protein